MGGRILLVDRYGAYLSVKEGRFVVRVRGEEGKWEVLADVSPAELDSIVFLVGGASLSASAVYLASKHGIDLVFIEGSRPLSRLVPATYGSSLKVWVKQLAYARNEGRRAELAKAFVEGKVFNQATVLKSFYRASLTSGKPNVRVRKASDALNSLRLKLRDVSSWREAGKVEAEAARIYWGAVKELLPEGLGFRRRLKKWNLPPGSRPDPFNSALNLGYSLLAKEVWRAVFMANLNPYIGFLHARRAGRMSLVFDLMEEFRPVAVDRPLIKLARRRPSLLSALKREGEVGREAAREVLKVVAETLRSGEPPLRNSILTQARRLARALLGEGEYRPFKVRW